MLGEFGVATARVALQLPGGSSSPTAAPTAEASVEVGGPAKAFMSAVAAAPLQAVAMESAPQTTQLLAGLSVQTSAFDGNGSSSSIVGDDVLSKMEATVNRALSTSSCESGARV